MKKLILFIGLVVAIIANVFGQETNKIIILVDEIHSSNGTINVSVFNSKEDFLNKPFLRQSIAATAGELKFEFDEVPNGEYTISIYHDENGNGILDKNFIGIPDEPYGISLEGKSMFGPPKYKDAKFTLNNESARLIISLD